MNQNMEQDNNYNNHEQDYGQDNKYNSYEPEYGTDYGINSYDKKPYGQDNSYDKSKDSSVIVKKIKCNNINVNLNGEWTYIGASRTGSWALATEAQAEDEGANGANLETTVEKATTIDHQVMTAILGLYV